ncbi:SCO family protein [Lederbergia panacisoli]|uniref:SCO family protein n=1 Tax=Lederbergia panacisoli TaxID=1255251 RepID=UPI00214BBF25|nr:SCO family protein [Lederbergia panacisoli]MCR2823500.1 SCO family protein [Lederbergia panacisoli]
MMRGSYNSVAVMLVLVFGFVLFYTGTDGFQAYTAETARVNKLMKEQPGFPSVMLEDSKGREYSISEFKGKYVLISFMYTSCTTVCVDLEWNMSQVFQQIPDKYLGEEIDFLSISFDPKRDTPEILDKYREHFNSDGEIWRMARIPNQQELDTLLKEFGVIVIPDEYGNFAHNSAFYLVDKKGTLVEVMDYKNIDGAIKKIVSTIEKEVGE